MLDGSQKLLLPWSLMSNVNLSWMLVNGHFYQRCHVRWFLTAYWRVRARVDAKCSFFSPRLLWRIHSSISSLQPHKAPVHPSADFFNNPRSEFTESAFKWFPVTFFWRCWLVMGRWPRCPHHWATIGANGHTNQTNPTHAKTLRSMCEHPCIKIFDMGQLHHCFTESGSNTENG